MSADRRRLICAALLVAAAVSNASAQRSGSRVASTDIFDAIGLREGLTVCEMGAGDGELTLAAARIVGPRGRVYTSELGDERLRALRERVAGSAVAHVAVVEGAPQDTNFPAAACDALFMRNVYHHFADPAAMNASIAASLKPGGRLAVVDFSPPNAEASAPGDRDEDGTHGVRSETLEHELLQAGFVNVSTAQAEDRWYMVVASRDPSH
jgi:ubiquinone/menaquinone biosynthesis C-methylase UbiE